MRKREREREGCGIIKIREIQQKKKNKEEKETSGMNSLIGRRCRHKLWHESEQINEVTRDMGQRQLFAKNLQLNVS